MYISVCQFEFIVRQPRGEPCTGGPTTGFCRLCTYEPSLSGITIEHFEKMARFHGNRHQNMKNWKSMISQEVV